MVAVRERKKSAFSSFLLPNVTLARGFFSFLESYHEFGLMLFIYFFSFFFLLDDNPRMRVRCTQSTSFSSSFFPSTRHLHDNFHTDGRSKTGSNDRSAEKSLSLTNDGRVRGIKYVRSCTQEQKKKKKKKEKRNHETLMSTLVFL